MSVICAYCGNLAELVGGDTIYPHRSDLSNKLFWRCRPCKAYVGTHISSPTHAPLGRLANAELRQLKQRVHAAFDPLWKSRKMTRNSAYAWLTTAMDIPAAECHVGMFNERRCRDALAVLASREATA